MYHSSRNCKKENHENFECNVTCCVVSLRRYFPMSQLQLQFFNFLLHDSYPSSQLCIDLFDELCFLYCRGSPSMELNITFDHLGYLKCFFLPSSLHLVKISLLDCMFPGGFLQSSYLKVCQFQLSFQLLNTILFLKDNCFTFIFSFMRLCYLLCFICSWHYLLYVFKIPRYWSSWLKDELSNLIIKLEFC